MLQKDVIFIYIFLDDGYRLTYLGYDFLALSALYKRGSVT